MYWGGRKKEDFFWSPSYKHLSVKSARAFSVKPNDSEERLGYVHDLALEDFGNFADVAVYACGSPEMIKDARKLFTANGLNQEMFFSDAFYAS